MEKTRSNPLIHLLPSLRDVAFFMPVLFVVLKSGGASRLIEGDTGWHIRTGEWILQNGRVPDKDFFSFTKPGETWFAWEWLWDLLFAWLHGAGGMAAVVLVSLLLICSVTLLLYREILRHSGNCLVAIGLTFLASAAGSIHWWARPHIVTLLFGLWTYALLDRAQTGSMRRLWILPPMMVLWTNLHGGFFVAILMIAAFAAGECAAAVLEPGPVERRRALVRAGKLGGIAVACLGASLVNPYHYHLHRHIYLYLSTDWHFKNIVEFFSVSFQIPAARYFEALLFLALPAAFWHLLRKRFSYVFLIVGWAHLALFAGRNIPVFALISAPLIGLAMKEWGDEFQRAGVTGWARRLWSSTEELASEISLMEAIHRLPIARLAGVAALALLFLAPAPPARFRADFDETFPAKALQAIEVTPDSRIFTTDEWGDYLIYKLYPRLRVFVDGRSDFYGEAFDQKYIDTINLKHGWAGNLEQYGIDTVLLPVALPMVGALKESSRWQVVYDDGVSIAFRSKDGYSADGSKGSVVSLGTTSVGGCSEINGSGSNVTKTHGRRDEI